MTEQNTNKTTQTVYYWIDGYWTLDPEEATEADQYGIYAGQHATLQIAESAHLTQHEINEIVKEELATTVCDRVRTVDTDTVCDRAHTVGEGVTPCAA